MESKLDRNNHYHKTHSANTSTFVESGFSRGKVYVANTVIIHKFFVIQATRSRHLLRRVIKHSNIIPHLTTHKYFYTPPSLTYMRVKPPFLVRRAILSGIPDAEDWYAGCHFWSKLDSDAMNWKVKTILDQKQSKFIIKSSFN